MKKLIILTLFTILLTGCATPQTNEVSNQNQEPITETETENQEVSLASMYQNYSEDQYQELKGTEPFALFFHADWCPKCQKLNSDLTANQSNLKGTILKTNFDQETELKKEFGVNMQTTFVIFDASGEVSNKLTNPTLEEINLALSES